MTQQPAPVPPPFTVKGWHVAAGVVAFFAVVISVDTAFLITAYRTHPGQVAPKPYEAGLIYNAELERQRTQAALGWRAGAQANPGQLEVVMMDSSGLPLPGLEVSALLQRPATEQGRTELALTETAPGTYMTPTDLAGTWDVRIEAENARGQNLIAERRLQWQ
jgi:nitrogen fixation protein FixH